MYVHGTRRTKRASRTRAHSVYNTTRMRGTLRAHTCRHVCIMYVYRIYIHTEYCIYNNITTCCVIAFVATVAGAACNRRRGTAARALRSLYGGIVALLNGSGSERHGMATSRPPRPRLGHRRAALACQRLRAAAVLPAATVHRRSRQ